MKVLYRILRLPPGTEGQYALAHHIWMALALTGLGCCVGLLSMAASLCIYEPMWEHLVLEGFCREPLFPAMNCLFPVLLIWLFYFLSGRAWAAYLGCALPVAGIVLANYYKIRLRTDPLLASDLRLALEAGDIAGSYDLSPGRLATVFLALLALGLIAALLLMPRGVRRWGTRIYGAATCLILTAVALAGPYSSDVLYEQADNDAVINPWSPAELYLSKGCVYSFLHSGKDLFPSPPQGYQKAEAAAAWEELDGHDIPPEEQVSVMAFMLEAFCDMTDFDALAGYEAVQELYAPWHALEEGSVSGDLLTNIFAGGTVDTEWAFLTGYSAHEELRSVTDSYVWYFRDQGYQTFGSHPGQEWFYNRQNVNRNLGFQDYRFLENYFAPFLTIPGAVRDSDAFLFQVDLEQLQARLEDGPCFSFSVTYQNHGPYESAFTQGLRLFDPGETGLSEESCNILNNYFDGLSRTIQAVTDLTGALEEMDEPVVLVLFGDHKPWAGNNASVYDEFGIDLYLSTLEGLRSRYSTPYLIWANSAAKEVLGRDFVGEGDDFSACFLMPKVFDSCGWQGPGFMELSRQMREISPLLHVSGRFLADGVLTDVLPEEEMAFYQRFLQIQYYREHEVRD